MTFEKDIRRQLRWLVDQIRCIKDKGCLDSGLEEDLTNHIEDKNNPHSTTAIQTGAVPSTGGTFTGAVTFEDAINVENITFNNDLFNTSAGRNSFISNTTGIHNTAVGAESLQYNTEGSYNVAIGSYSLYDNTTGINNTAVGDSALYSNTTGNLNSALGTDALYYNTSGTENTAIGMSALFENTTGSRNIALGVYSLYSSITASDNIALGVYSLNSNIKGENNIAIGNYSLSSNTNGYYNIALGNRALSKNATGSINIAIGYQALYNNEKGMNNVAIGHEAGMDNKGHDNIFIGNAAGVNETGDNTLYIGNSRFGYPPLIFGDFLTRRLGIENKNPSETLDVNGNIKADNAILSQGKLTINNISNIPTGSSDVWSDNGVLKIGTTASPNNTTSSITSVQTTGKTIARHNDGDSTTVDIKETITSLSINANILTYTKEDNTTDTIDLSLYLDDTNLARLVSGTLDSNTGIATFTRDDSSTFTVDFSSLSDVQPKNTSELVNDGSDGANPFITLQNIPQYSIDIVANQLILYKDGTQVGSEDLSVYIDNTNLPRLVNGSFNNTTGIATFTRDDSTSFTVDFSALLNSSSTDLTNHINDASNPHSTTALQVGAVPSTGGTFTDTVSFEDIKFNNSANNVIIGKDAFISSTTGSHNVSVGNGSLLENTTGSNNVAVGISALWFNTEGTENIGIGGLAGSRNTSGINNISIGFKAGAQNEISSNNIAIGNYSLENNKAEENVALGNETLLSNTTGDYNVAIGNSALQNNTTGFYNISIGTYAGRNNNGNNNVFIGSGAGFNKSTVSNKLCIDTGARTTSLIYGDFDTNKVGINDENLTETLNVGGNILASGTIVGRSDARLKSNVRSMSEAEERAILSIETKIYTRNDLDDNKLHAGVIAQDVISAFKKEGLDAHKYALISGEGTEDSPYSVAYFQLLVMREQARANKQYV